MADTTETAHPSTGGNASKSSSSGSPFMRKLGPMPVWAWMAIALALAIVYSMWSKNKEAATAAATTGNTGTETQQTADQTPPFIIQNYTTYPGGPATTTTTTTPPPTGGATTLPGSQTGPATLPPTKSVGAPPATVSVPKSSSTTTTPKYTAYVVKAGDTLSSIAAKYHTTWQALWDYNIGSSSPHSKAAIAELKSRGPKLLYTGETIYIPS